MKLFRNLLFWIVLALLGALIAQVLVQDPGYVLVRFRGMDYTTTLAVVVLVAAGVLVALWLLWKLVTVPVLGLRRRRRRAARTRLYDGLEAYELGQWERAAQRLDEAARSPVVASDGSARLAHVAAARAAMATGDRARLDRHLAALDAHPAERAVLRAEAALGDGHAEEALRLLDEPAAQPLPPHGLALRVRALEATGRADEAYGMLGALRSQHALPPSELDRLQARWARQALQQAEDANSLADRWEAIPEGARRDPAIVAAYASRAADLRWEDAATGSIERALDAGWDESLVGLYGRLPVGRLEARQERVAKWAREHPDSPGVLLARARLARASGQWPEADEHARAALARGAGPEAWEELGHARAQAGDERHARIAYANALQAARGEPVSALPEDPPVATREPAPLPAADPRDDHGLPRAPDGGIG